jgi:Fe2+ or Zn2+ uptake regulation protein
VDVYQQADGSHVVWFDRVSGYSCAAQKHHTFFIVVDWFQVIQIERRNIKRRRCQVNKADVTLLNSQISLPERYWQKPTP